jgi:hypothetical protein
VSRELIEKFSKRTLEIERLCKEKYTILEARARKLMRGHRWILPTRSLRSRQTLVKGEENAAGSGLRMQNHQKGGGSTHDF